MRLRLCEMLRLKSRLRTPRPARARIVRPGGAHLPNWARIPNDLALLNGPIARTTRRIPA